MENRIYADWAATAPVAREVLEAMLPYLDGRESFGNPSTPYAEGVAARRALENAREEVAAAIGAHPDEVIFVSGGTEADNLAVHSATVGAGHPERRKILTSPLEHSAVRRACEATKWEGFRVETIPLTPDGVPELPALAAMADADTALVTLMVANHETGILQPVREAAEIVHAAGAYLLSDAVQAATVGIDAHGCGADYMSISGHKLGTPRGIGALYVRQGAPIVPLLWGGGQERGARSGTENVAGAVGLATALRLAGKRRAENGRLAELAAELRRELLKIPGVTLNSAENPADGLPGVLNLSFDCVEGQALVLFLDRQGICASAGAACSSWERVPSPVLTGMGRSEAAAMGSVRFSLSYANTLEEIKRIAAETARGVERLRKLDLEGEKRYCPSFGTK